MLTPIVHELTRAGMAVIPAIAAKRAALAKRSLVIPMGYVGEPDIPPDMDVATYRHVRRGGSPPAAGAAPTGRS